MSFALYFRLFGIFVFFPKTDAGELTWKEPLPIQSVPDNDTTDHLSKKELWEGTRNATIKWHFALKDLGFDSLSILLGSQVIAGVRTSAQGPQPGFENEYGLKWIASQNLVTLLIFDVTAKVNGEFTCRVIAVKGVGTIPFSSIVQVNVVAPSSNMKISGDQTRKAPDELTLNCTADGKPKPNITWTRVSDNTVVYMPLSIIRGMNEVIYRCTADNGVGNPLTKDVKINVQFSPKVMLRQKVFVDRERTASLTCQVEGNPTPAIFWSRCDLPNLLCDKQYLNVSKVQTARANYTCTASNDLGRDSATTMLILGGFNIYLRLSVSGECKDKDSVWETLKNELSKVFANTQSYNETQQIDVRCGSLIFDLVLKFNTEVAEDDTISIIQNAIVDGKLGELSVNVSYIMGIPPIEQTTITAPTSTTSKSDDNTGLIIGAVLGSVAFVALIVFIVWCVRKKKCCSETKEVSDNTDSAQGRKGKGQNGGDEVAYASTSMLPHSKRPVEKTNQGTVQALPMYAQVDKTKKTSNKGGAAQRQRQPGELQYAEVEHVTSGRSLPRKSSSEPIKPSNEEIVYADLV